MFAWISDDPLDMLFRADVPDHFLHEDTVTLSALED
jgi:hypothetical protein